jgi:hypothetical protein
MEGPAGALGRFYSCRGHEQLVWIVSAVLGDTRSAKHRDEGSHSQAGRISQSRLQRPTAGAVCILDGVNRAAVAVVVHSQAPI